MRRRRFGKQNEDPDYNCVVCACDFRSFDESLFEERPDWEGLLKNWHKGRSFFVPATEMEQMDFKQCRDGWWDFYRTSTFIVHSQPPRLWLNARKQVLDDPKTDRILVSGIEKLGLSMYWYPGPASTDSSKARIIWPYRGLKENHYNWDFHMADLLGPDRHREQGRRIGYPVHAHCWLLLKRVIGPDIVESNLRPLVHSIEAFWRDNKDEWTGGALERLHHEPGELSCFDQDSFGQRHAEMPTYRSWWEKQETERHMPDDEVRHRPGSPFRIPQIQELMKQVTQENRTTIPYRALQSRSVAQVPLEIAVTIVDMISSSGPVSRQRVDDTRNLLEAFHWILPNSYWISRCEPSLVYEAEDLLQSGKVVNWAAFCLGLEELLIDPHWFCNSGLNHRRQILHKLGEIKKCFLQRVNNRVTVE